MRLRVMWLTMALGLALGLGMKASAEIYLWIDEQGVVHMTDQWEQVPESMRARVSVREGSDATGDAIPSSQQPTHPVEPPTVKQPPLQMAPDLSETPPPTGSSPSVTPDARDTSVLIPRHRPFVHQPKRLSPPFPYNVRLDPFDPNFVWVGPNRVPKDTFTYPHVSLEKQAQFRHRVRALEERRSSPRDPFRSQPSRPR
jgi:hypothetical protein